MANGNQTAMTLDIGILFAVTTMLSWGISDFFAKQAINKIGYKTPLFLNHTVALIPIIIFAFLFFKMPAFSVGLVSMIILAGVLGIVGYIFLYRGFQNGNVSIVAPVASSWSVLTTLFAFFLFNETLTSLQLLGIITVFVGIFLASTNLAELKQSIRLVKTNGILDGVIAMTAWGISYTLIRPVSEVTGPIVALLFFRAIAFMALLSWTGITKTKITLPTRLIFFLIAAAGILDFVGYAAFNVSMTQEFVSIAGPIAATCPAVTIILAYVFLKEKMVNNQKLGILAILTGLVLVTLA